MKNQYPSQYIRPLPSKERATLRAGTLDPEAVKNFDGGEDVPLREYWRVVFKYRWMIAGCMCLALLAGLLFIFTTTPEYTASSKIRLGAYESVLTSAKIEDLLEKKSQDSAFMETQIQEIRSLSLADLVLQDDEVRSTIEAELQGGLFSGFLSKLELADSSGEAGDYLHPVNYIEAYLKKIAVKPIRKTYLVVIQATHANARTAAHMSNVHAEKYIDWVRNVRVKQQSRGLQFLRGQSEELKLKTLDLENELAEYAEANSIVALNKDENITVQKMAQLNELLTQATATRIEAEESYNEALRAAKEGNAAFDDQSVQTMKGDLARLESEASELSAKFTPNYPRVKQIKSEIAGLRAVLADQRQQITRGLKTKANAAKRGEEMLLEQLDQQKSHAFELSKRQVQYNVLNRELAATRELLENVERQIKETSLTVESNATNVSLVDAAVAPKIPSYPRKKLVLFFSLCGGAALGLCLAFLLSHLDNTIRTPEDLERTIKLPCLGVVPAFELEGLNTTDQQALPGTVASRERLPQIIETPPGQNATTRTPITNGQRPLVFNKDPKSLAAEAYRTIRTGILLSQAGEPPRTILVTSSQSSEGKTTLTLNLAASLASAGARVVLIDADLRRPQISRSLGIRPELRGLVDILTGQCSIKDASVSDALQRVTVIPSGSIPPNPAELLGSYEMARLIDLLARDFDYVLIDSPPILPVTDSVILSRYVDGSVLVVKGGSTPKRVVQDARNRLASVGARILGIVLNDVDVTAGDYYYYNRYYYSYDQQQRGEDIDGTRLTGA